MIKQIYFRIFPEFIILKVRNLKTIFKFLAHKVYRVLFFDDCPNWQDLGPRSVYRIRELVNKKNLPEITFGDKVIVQNIVRNGVHLSSLDEVGFENTQNFKRLANQLFEETSLLFKTPVTHLGGHFKAEKYTLRPPTEYILEKYPEIFHFALNPRLLSIVQHYIGAPASLLDIDFKIDFPFGNNSGNKHWHYDMMNYKIMKIFIYFSDVTKSSPAFEYVHPSACMGIKEFFFKEERIYDLTDKKNIIRVEAPSESILFIGVDRVLHHLSIPTHKEDKIPRKAVVLHYLSKEIPDQCKQCFKGAAPKWGTEKVTKLLHSFRESLPEQTRKYLYIHDS
jgi:hypothetical protein